MKDYYTLSLPDGTTKTINKKLMTAITMEIVDREGVLAQDLYAWVMNPENISKTLIEYLKRENKVIEKLIENKEKFAEYMADKILEQKYLQILLSLLGPT